MSYENLTGRRFGRLTALEVIRGARKLHWLCLCVCGKETIVSKCNLVTAHTKSCGCLSVEATKKANTKHGHNKTGKPSSEYTTWASMIQRCTNPKTTRFENHGGRGITICSRWLNSFENFLADMGLKPFQKAQLDRENNNGNYEPGNCRWVTRLVNAGNKRNTIVIIYQGEAKTISEWSKAVGIKASTLRDRYHQGWSHSRMLEQEPRSLYKPN